MAVASAWAKPGSWALAAEEQDDLQPPPVPAADFPSLATAATTKVPKKKKPQAVSLAAFNSAKFVAPASRGPTHDELLSLPTGPRERTEEELANARGFGARWGGTTRGSDDPRRGGSGLGGPQEFGPSRADEADDWGAGKKPLERRERMGGFGGDSMSSRADDADDWVSIKRAAPAPPMERRDRCISFGGDSRADDSASWVSNKGYAPPPPPPSDSRRGGSVWGFNRDGGPDADSWERKREEVSSGGVSSGARPRLVLQKRTLPIVNGNDGEKEDKEEEKLDIQPKTRTSNPFGAARPREEVLAAKGEDWRKEDKEEDKLEIQPKTRTSNPFGAARPREEVLAAKGEDWRKEDKEEDKLEIQPKTKTSNPFGAARPREEVLAAKGEDWRKIDEKLEAMKVQEAPPERRSFGRRGSPVSGEENGNSQPESRADRAWRKPDAIESTGESEEGPEATQEGIPAN